MHLIETRIRDIRRRAFALRLLVSTSVTLGVILLTLTFFSWLSVEWSIESSPIRWLLFFATVAVALFMLRWMVSCIRRAAGEGDEETAQRIEAVFPEFHGQLSSALSFLRGAFPGTSASMRRHVIGEAESTLERVSLADCLDFRRPLVLSGVGLLVLSSCVLVAALYPARTSAHLKRLLQPWKSVVIPPTVDLVWINQSSRIGRNDTLVVRALNQIGPPPANAEVQFWFKGESIEDRQRFPLRRSGRVLIHRLTNVRKSFRLRLVAGRDASQWYSVDVVDVPKVDQLRIRIRPPAYTGQPVSVTTTRNPSVVSGSQIGVSGKLRNRQLKDLTLVYAAEKITRIPLDLRESGAFELKPENGPQVDKAIAYWFEARDQAGFRIVDPRKWIIEGLKDQSPTLRISLIGLDDKTVWPSRMLVRLELGDDQHIQEGGIQVKVRRAQSLEPEAAVKIPVAQQDPAPGKVRTQVDETLEVNEDLLGNLAPGDQLEIAAYAVDSKQQAAVSAPRTVTIVDDRSWRDLIQNRQLTIIQRLQELTQQQEEVLEANQKQMGHYQSGQAPDNPELVIWEQRKVLGQLWGEDSIVHQVAGLLASLRGAPQSVDAVQPLQELAETLAGMEQGLLPEVDATLSRMQSSLKNSEAMLTSSRDLERQQKRIIRRLKRHLSPMTATDELRRYSARLMDLLERQTALAQRTKQIQLQVLMGMESDEEFAQIEEEQETILLGWQRINTTLRQFAESVSVDDVTTQVRQALEHPANRVTSEELTAAMIALRQKQWGRAATAQQHAMESWRQVLATLGRKHSASESGSASDSRLVEIARQLRKIRDEQAEVRKLTSALTSRTGSEDLLRRQSEIEDQVRRLMEVPTDSSGVVDVALSQLVEVLQRVTRIWQDGGPMREVVQGQTQSLDLFDRLLEALEPSTGKDESASNTQENRQGPGGGAISIQELKLAIEVQTAILEETKQIEERRRAGTRQAGDPARLAILADRQKDLLKLLQVVTEPTQTPAGGDPATAKPDRGLDTLPGFGDQE